jgi:ATP-dependent RNA helicase SUPV3L1/SUV3
LTKAFTDIEIELRKSRPYDGFDMDSSKFWTLFRQFENEIETAIKQALRAPSRRLDPKIEDILNQILRSMRSPVKLAQVLKVGFYNRVMVTMFTATELERQKAMTDCRYPMEWFPRARLVKRVLHLHVGPTNSGKTYQALKKLEEAKLGCYAGPLRLLAQEIYGRMNARGKPTWLVTGDDQQTPTIPFDPESGEAITSCTVEMMDFEQQYDVAVIDEVQMAADSARGHAWTAAIVGVPAKEVHLCGEERTVPLIQEIARSLGEELIVHRYQRLSPLAVMNQPLGNMSRLEKGDCIVCFSVMRIHAMKRYVEKMTGKRVAIIYGSLPPEVRAQQARLFNEHDNDYDFLVASDAIGMGLNL